MSEEYDDLDCFKSGKTLLIDGDIVVYQPCCTHNEEGMQAQRSIQRAIERKVSGLVSAAGCDDYRFFVTTKKNFRDHLVDDYKANRSDKERPIHLAWAKRLAVSEYGAEAVPYLEADDLLGINQTEDTVIWSLDKDLRQVPGAHLDDESMQVVIVDDVGLVEKRTKVSADGKKKHKVYFNGLVGFYLQLLMGDSTDWIVGCGKRGHIKLASGKMRFHKKDTKKNKIGDPWIGRMGVGEMAALKLLEGRSPPEALKQVARAYYAEFGDEWKSMMETQANLLWMSREYVGDQVKMWTFDNRDQYLNIKTGVITDAPDQDD
jgi:5'-3' exonuclease